MYLAYVTCQAPYSLWPGASTHSIAGLSCTKAIDIFAAACVIIEMCSGRSLLPYSENDLERLATIQAVIGAFSYDFARSVESVRQDIFCEMDPPRIDYPKHAGDANATFKLKSLPTVRVREYYPL